ncbi:N-acetylmuramic acid 6-phosphate etherase [Microbispora bryophytorum]|uniref:N-acetylmuramic acid 6-phosphate etherase n=1 Tax=Microbispora bryophytorum TaxID=1460882 RepID=A0A8H9GX79_9ACTN|nr:N-acetylmuramic acid 6-phosphate etherase [Microbispora bryophytorum]MBD3140150.1 N-acetylmuramic acid 6-phosphate etherase [Microbispora bryophytorum]TQS02265.1 N-acetylmuramic acid 6-phosphate etherase [Microbispora bryophytorum]GGO06437.1 N-acetylmuramic acid 6-phosphate etherase [Microbispora bryophytorum]
MTHSLAALATEQSDPRFSGIDTLPTEEIARLMNAADAAVPAAVGRAVPAIAAAVDAIAARMADGGRLLYVGAGTSGRLAVLDASECPPTFGTHPDLVQGIIAGGEAALVRSVEGAEDDAEAGAAVIRGKHVGPLDSVVGISASGRAPYVVAAVEQARRLGALTVGLACNTGTPLARAADHAVEVIVGPEVVTGSTRLKAGTAQKLVLNMISTITMIRSGRTYGNFMVDVVASNSKLVDRAARIVSDITGTQVPRAREVLESAGRDVKTAVVMIERGVGADDARALLAAHGNRLGPALHSA